MKKAKSSRTPERSDIVDLRSDKPFDTLKAQVLVKIADILNPNQLKYDDYNITFTVPRKITNPLPLDSAAKYQHLVTHALQIKTMPSAKIAVEPKLVSDSGLSSVSYIEPAQDRAATNKENEDAEDDDRKAKSKGRRKTRVSHIYVSIRAAESISLMIRFQTLNKFYRQMPPSTRK